MSTTSTRGHTGRTRRVLVVSALVTFLLPTLGGTPAVAAAPPDASFNPISSGRNVALFEAGSSVIARTSSLGGCYEPYSMLTYSNDDCGWHTSYSAVPTNEWVKFELIGGGTYLIDSIQMLPWYSSWLPKDIKIDVSTTTSDDAAFTNALTATAANSPTWQTFALPQPVFARYVRFTMVNTYNCCYAAMRALRIMTGTQGNRTVTFDNLSTDADGDIVSTLWDFGDGTTSSQSEPTHAFPPGAGTYTVTLTVTDSLGATDTFSTQQKVLVPPVADFTTSATSISEGTAITFTNTSSDADGGGMIAGTWSFGNGDSASTTAATISRSYCDNGTFTPSLSVLDDDERWGSVSKPGLITVTNLPPIVNAYGDRFWLSGERLAYYPGISDPGCDSHSHRWEHSDIGVQNNTYLYDRTVAVPVGAAPRRVTSTYTATDDDGASASDNVDVTYFPRAFQAQSAGGVGGLYGVDFSPVLNAPVVLWDQGSCRKRLSFAMPDGALRHIGGNLASGCGESDLAVSRGSGGFAAGELLLSNGANGQIARLATDSAGTLISSANPWVTLPGVSARLGGLAFDTSGAFDGDLLTVWTDGKVFRTGAGGTSSLVASLGKLLEGATFAPATGFGPASGCLLTTDVSLKNVIAVCPDGTSTVVRNIPAGANLESLTAITSAGDLIATDPDRNQLQRADSGTFGSAQAGHVMISTVTGGEIWDLAYDAEAGAYTSAPFALLMRPGEGGATVHVEQITFVPALASTRTSLTPATATLRVGQEHTVSATVLDSTGNAVPGVELTFTVSGANTASEVRTTDANGVASSTYTGSAAGVDSIVASAGGISTPAVSATWVRTGTDLKASPAIASATGTGNEVTAKLRARLTDEAGAALAGRTVTFTAMDPVTANPAVVCTATTGVDGVAECPDPAHLTAAWSGAGYRAVFDGDARYAGSDDTAPLVLIDRDLP